MNVSFQDIATQKRGGGSLDTLRAFPKSDTEIWTSRHTTFPKGNPPVPQTKPISSKRNDGTSATGSEGPLARLCHIDCVPRGDGPRTDAVKAAPDEEDRKQTK